MIRDSLYFVSPGQVEIRENESELMPNQVVVKTGLSAISAGTELLVYRGQLPNNLKLDETIDSLQEGFQYPLKYGYSVVGEIVEVGNQLEDYWLGRRVFSFNPHESYFSENPNSLILIPDDVSLEDAVFFSNVETAVNLVMDGQPQLGEKIVVVGLGIVGLLTTSLLAQYPLDKLYSFDVYPMRREFSVQLGAHQSFDPLSELSIGQLKNDLTEIAYREADLVYELSGEPDALNLAIQLAGFDARIVVGSWYGAKQGNIILDSHFHRNRISIISSQVSTISPKFTGRWNKNRRYKLTWEMIRKIQPSKLITHRYSLNRASKAFKLIDEFPQDALQVIFEY